MFLQFLSLMYPPDVTAGAGGSGATVPSELSKDDIYDFLGKDDEKEEVIDLPEEKKETKESKESKKDEKKAKDDKDESEKEDEEDDEAEGLVDDELKALEEELEEPGEEKLELTTPTSRREILKKYPTLFKDFPYLETAYYREQEFTKILPTIADAREAVEKSRALDNFEQQLISGNTHDMLKAVKDADQNAFYKIVDDYLPTLGKVDPAAYHHVIGNVIKYTIMNMVQEANTSNNEELKVAANILHQFAFMSSKFTPPGKLSTEEKKDDSKEREQNERERKYIREKYQTASREVNEKFSKACRATIEANIDPKGTMSEFVKKSAVRDASEELDKLIKKDSRFKTIVDKLYERAAKSNFDTESLDKIRSAYASKARTLLQAVIKKARNEAIKGSSSRSKNDDDSRQSDESKNGKGSSRNKESRKGDESHRRNDSGDKKSVPDGMSSLEYLMSSDD